MPITGIHLYDRMKGFLPRDYYNSKDWSYPDLASSLTLFLLTLRSVIDRMVLSLGLMKLGTESSTAVTWLSSAGRVRSIVVLFKFFRR